MTEMREINDAHGYIRRHPEIFFWSGRPNACECATNLVRDALVAGATEAGIARLGAWWVVGADIDWLARADLLTIFGRIIPAPEMGVNSMRSEVVVGALADTVVAVDRSGATIVLGSQEGEFRPICELLRMKGWARAIGFTLRVEVATGLLAPTP